MIAGSVHTPLDAHGLQYRDPRKSWVGVYGILNLVNGKTYIGSTGIGLSHRFSEHRSDLNRGVHRNIKLQRAWRKYGESAFRFFIVKQCRDGNHALLIEQFLLDVMQPEYNIATCAEASARGSKMSIEGRRNISLGKLGKKHTALHRQRNSEAQLRRGYRMPKGHSDMLQAKLRAKMQSDPNARNQWISRLSSSHKGKILSPESKAKLSASIKASWQRRKEALHG